MTHDQELVNMDRLNPYNISGGATKLASPCGAPGFSVVSPVSNKYLPILIYF
nr:hypothetical protein [Pedobacter panaciterrae]